MTFLCCCCSEFLAGPVSKFLAGRVAKELNQMETEDLHSSVKLYPPDSERARAAMVALAARAKEEAVEMMLATGMQLPKSPLLVLEPALTPTSTGGGGGSGTPAPAVTDCGGSNSR